MIILYTRTSNIFSIEYLKWIAKKIIKKNDGPKAVQESLYRGLKELNIEYKINKKPTKDDILIILSGVDALKKGIEFKKKNLIKKLIAGPNIFASPTDHNSLICSESVDTILVPAEWVLELWASMRPDIKDKIKVWPAGVQIKESSKKDSSPIIYDKLYGDPTSSTLETQLNSLGYNPTVLKYGNFKQRDFFNILDRAPFLIYLSKSESQGLAIQEAWARDVPTLIMKSDGYKGNNQEWHDEKINAPYLNDNLGFFFNNSEELEPLIEKCKTLKPKIYCDEFLSDKACTKILLDLI